MCFYDKVTKEYIQTLLHNINKVLWEFCEVFVIFIDNTSVINSLFIKDNFLNPKYLLRVKRVADKMYRNRVLHCLIRNI